MGKKELPIIFSTPMVKAILDGKKTQTRRVIKPDVVGSFDLERDGSLEIMTIENNFGDQVKIYDLCPYGKPGDRLWVRETHARIPHMMSVFADVHYFADGPMPSISERHDEGLFKKYPSIHMPKWAARIWLEIIGVRIERLQDISREDAKAEGFLPSEYNGLERWDGRIFGNANLAFMACWDSINGKKKGRSWADNPWVWVVEFKPSPRLVI